MNPIGGLILLILLVVVIIGTRHQALLAMAAGVLYLSQSQSLNVFGVNLFAVRFLEVAAMFRVLARGEFSLSRLTKLDWAVLWLYGFSTCVLILRSPGEIGAAVATALDAGLTYFSFRGLLQKFEDLRWFLSTLVILLIPLMLLLVVERKTGRIPLPFMAGSAGVEGSFMRNGIPRCFGSFRNMDLLGTLGSSFLPLYVAMVAANVDRRRAIVGGLFCLAIVGFSNAGGPTSCVGAGALGWALWPLRSRMRYFRWGLGVFFLILALVMKAPIWYFLDRVSSITGGDGWHRSYLIDIAVKHLPAWWLMGIPIASTREWFPYMIEVTGGADITNQYLLFGITAGVGAIALLVLLLTRAYSCLGKALGVLRSQGSRMKGTELALWGLGVMLSVHVVNWLGITYFDQFYVIWFLQLAAISTLTQNVIRSRHKALVPNGIIAVSATVAVGPAHGRVPA